LGEQLLPLLPLFQRLCLSFKGTADVATESTENWLFQAAAAAAAAAAVPVC